MNFADKMREEKKGSSNEKAEKITPEEHLNNLSKDSGRTEDLIKVFTKKQFAEVLVGAFVMAAEGSIFEKGFLASALDTLIAKALTILFLYYPDDEHQPDTYSTVDILEKIKEEEENGNK